MLTDIEKTEAAPFGILVDSDKREGIGPATQEQREAHIAAGPGGIFLIDEGGNVLKDADGYEGTLRRVFVDLERMF